MSAWSGYTLSDLLLFSPRVYERLLELHNAQWWPAHFAAIFSGLVIIACVFRTTAFGGRLVYALLGAAWLFVAWAFFATRYQSINWAAEYIAPIIAIQGLLLLVLAAWRHPPDLMFRVTPPGVIAILVLIFGIFGYPFVAALSGRSWQSAEFFTLTPDPTAIVTLAVLALSTGAARWLAMLIPIAWCIISGLTLSTLGWPDFFVAPLAGLLCFGAAFCQSSKSEAS